ncbi:hypothetical protein B7494_g5699 [Chlorociboria aeruginascens]|nr:hypothetical protein B7494_g5699 [Chlorociboria aeruginascens]
MGRTSLDLLSSSTCCTDRDAPSPDPVPPRLVRATPTRLVPRDPTPIVSWGAASQLSKPEDIARLRAIFEDDKIDSEDELECDHLKPRRSSIALNAVKSKLKKHLSRDSAISKRHSRSTIGTSEEEVERRAELRRIRQRRILEELSSEGVYDDDAKSISTFSSAHGSSVLQNRASWIPGDQLCLPCVNEHICVLNEKHVDETISPKALISGSYPKALSEPDVESSNTLINSTVTPSRRFSSPGPSELHSDLPIPQAYIPIRRRSSIPEIPLAPVLKPRRLSSIGEPRSQSSWRLSFTAQNRAEHLRKLSQEHTNPNILNLGEPLLVTQPINKWLQSQGLRSSSEVIERSDEKLGLDPMPSRLETCTISKDFGGVDGIGDAPPILHLYEMDISQRLASRGLQSSASSPHLSSLGSQSRHRESIGGASRHTQNSRAHYLQSTSDSAPLSERIPPSWGGVLQDGTSSFYPSTGNSIQPSPHSSRFDLLSLLSGNKSVEIAEQSNSISRLDSRASLAVPVTTRQRRPADSSLFASETESFLQRESELCLIQKRFAGSEARRSPSAPISSKFREEFDPKPILNHAPASKSSPFRILAKFASRTFDGTGDKDVSGDDPSSGIGFRYQFPSPESSSKSPQIEQVDPFSRINSPALETQTEADKMALSSFTSSPEAQMVELEDNGFQLSAINNSFEVPLIVQNDSKESSVSTIPRKPALKLKIKIDKAPPPIVVLTGPEDSVSTVWGRAMAKHGDEKAKEVKARVPRQSSGGQGLKVAQSFLRRMSKDRRLSKSPASPSQPPSSFSGSDHEGEGKRVSDAAKFSAAKAARAKAREEAKLAKAKEQSKAAIIDWEIELAATARKAQMKSKTIIPKEKREHIETAIQQNAYPHSWSRFPNHNREERNTIVRVAEGIQGHDFAIKHEADNTHEVEWFQAKRKHQFEHHHQETKAEANSFTGKLGKKFRTKVYGWRTGKRHVLDDEIGGRKGSTSVGGELECPELELLPIFDTPNSTITRLETEATEQFRVDGSQTILDIAEQTAFGDGSLDGAQVITTIPPDLEDSEISIAHPKFYDDCVLVPTDAEEGLARDFSPRGEKYRTWNGRDWDKFIGESMKRNSAGELLLRNSTVSFQTELEAMERTEKERAVSITENA